MRSGKTLSGFRATLLCLCRLRSPAWATWVLSEPHTSDSWTFWQELNPTFQTCCYGQILPGHSLRFIAHGTLPIHRATPGARFVQPRVDLRSRLDLKSRSRKRRPTRLQVMTGLKLGEANFVFCEFPNYLA